MMRFDRFSQQAQDVAARAYEVCQRYGHNQVDTEHIFYWKTPAGFTSGWVSD
ncbi:MAG: hypothetical protein AAB217_11080 [Chloroflexota bacterium]